MSTYLGHILMGGALTSVLVTRSRPHPMLFPSPVVTARDIAGAVPTEQVYWYGRLPASGFARRIARRPSAER